MEAVEEEESEEQKRFVKEEEEEDTNLTVEKMELYSIILLNVTIIHEKLLTKNNSVLFRVNSLFQKIQLGIEPIALK
jgi:hypothetical protein